MNPFTSISSVPHITTAADILSYPLIQQHSIQNVQIHYLA